MNGAQRGKRRATTLRHRLQKALQLIGIEQWEGGVKHLGFLSAQRIQHSVQIIAKLTGLFRQLGDHQLFAGRFQRDGICRFIERNRVYFGQPPLNRRPSSGSTAMLLW